MSKKQSAVTELVNYMKANFHLTDESIEMMDKAEQKFEEQIIEAYTECWSNDGGNANHKLKEAEQYYKETYE